VRPRGLFSMLLRIRVRYVERKGRSQAVEQVTGANSHGFSMRGRDY
jgi:hypothetical protein